uniref:Uncharacterized protein n=1 Tax=Arundo donax TaxID=35708 RepID=A0A0A9BSX1_ARUDO
MSTLHKLGYREQNDDKADIAGERP